jgi:hypothetical protein
MVDKASGLKKKASFGSLISYNADAEIGCFDDEFFEDTVNTIEALTFKGEKIRLPGHRFLMNG